MANNAYIQHKKNDILSMLRIYFTDPDLVPHDIFGKNTHANKSNKGFY